MNRDVGVVPDEPKRERGWYNVLQLGSTAYQDWKRRGAQVECTSGGGKTANKRQERRSVCEIGWMSGVPPWEGIKGRIDYAVDGVVEEIMKRGHGCMHNGHTAGS